MLKIQEGEMFSELRVVSELNENEYLCCCSCGQYCHVHRDFLLTGQAKHCGICVDEPSAAEVKWITTD